MTNLEELQLAHAKLKDGGLLESVEFFVLASQLMPQLLAVVEQREKLGDILEALPTHVKLKYDLYSLVDPKPMEVLLHEDPNVAR